MRNKFFLLIVMVFAVVMCSGSIVFAHTGDVHNKEMEKGLFGGKANKEQKAAAKALAAAAYLTIDQFGGNGQGNLKTLEEYGVKNLPELETIDISSSEISHHREYTHQGWDSKYRDIERNGNRGVDEKWSNKWEKRKDILENTVEDIFDFNWWSGIPFIGKVLPDYGKQGDSLCALIYYTHLLGDHEATKKMKQYNYLMPVGGRIDNNDIIHEVLYHCNVLFASQSKTHEFSMFTMKMEEINSKYYKLFKVNEENLKTNQEYAKNVLETMQKYIPEFLEKEEFYKKIEEFQNAA